MAGRIVYSIPKDGEVLRERHLRNQSTFLLSEAGGAWRGTWGVFRPLDVNVDVNQVSVESNDVGFKLVVRNLAAVTPDGFVIRSTSGSIRKLLPVDASAHRELVVCIRPAWMGERNGEEWDDHGPIIKILSPADAAKKQKESYMELARIDTASKRCDISAPALGIDATEQLRSAWGDLCALIKQLGTKLVNSQRGELFERLNVNSAFNRILRLPIVCDPRQAGWILTDVFGQYANFVEVFSNDQSSGAKKDDSANRARDGAHEFTKAAEQCFEASGGRELVSLGTDRLIARLIEFINLLSVEIDGSTGIWLTVEAEELGYVGESRDGPKYVKRFYKFVGGSLAESILVEAWTSQGGRPSIAGLIFDNGELIEYGATGDCEEIQGKMYWQLKRPKGSQRITVRCPRHTKTKLIVTPLANK